MPMWDFEAEAIYSHCQKKAMIERHTVIDPATDAFGQWLLREIEPGWELYLCRVDQIEGKDPVFSLFLSPEKGQKFIFSVLIFELETRFEYWKWESPNPFLAIIDKPHEELTIIPLPGEKSSEIIKELDRIIVPF